MISRFTGENGKRRLLDVLLTQKFIAGDHELASSIVEEGKLVEFDSGSFLIKEGGDDNEIFFIVHGSVNILVHGRLVARRSEGMHVGEMALIDPTAIRCADVVAQDKVIALVVSEPSFVAIAHRTPELWRRLAKELANRLRQRNSLVISPNSRPHLFIGSSVEALSIARAIQLGLEHDDVTVSVWTDGVFGTSTYAVESLEKEIQTADFGLIVLSPDDEIIKRNSTQLAPRDNVIFELGMCMGALTRQRSFVVQPRGVDLHIPTDLMGLTPLSYKLGPEQKYDTAMAPVCERLRRLIVEKGPR
ncbi:nucleotide-binding protein [Leptothoe sp. LEGE 181152]|nr:nucleotide-binding protein [Leptothoe sp. LEGE 181152]